MLSRSKSELKSLNLDFFVSDFRLVDDKKKDVLALIVTVYQTWI